MTSRASKRVTGQADKNLYVHALRFGFYSLPQALAVAVLLVHRLYGPSRQQGH